MRILKIKDIGKVVSGATPKTEKEEYWNGSIPWVTPKEMGQLTSQYLYTTERKITELGFKSCSTSLIPRNNVLFTSRAPIGFVAVNKIDVCTNQGFKNIILNEGFYALYVYYYLKNQKKQLNNLGTGTTFKELSKTVFERFEIPVPNYKDQIRIATLLSKAEELITQRKESIKLLDEYAKSVFAEMFGDPVKNEKKWKTVKFRELAKINRIHVSPTEISNSDLYIGLEDIEKETGNIIKNSTSNSEELKSSKFRFTSNHILYAKLRPYLNKVALPQENGICSTDIFPILPNPETSSRYFLCYLMRTSYFVNEMTAKSAGANLPRASASTIENLKVYSPPVSLQKRFTEIVEKAEFLKTQYQQSLEELENLFGSLSQQAFKGELDLHKIKSKFIDKEIEEAIKSTKQTEAVDKYPKEDEEGTRYGDPFEVDEATAKKQGDMFYNEWLRLHGKIIEEENESVWLQSKRSGLRPTMIKFNSFEGNAIINEFFSKQNTGFGFSEFESALKTERITYTAKEIKEFIFQKLEQKELVQYYATKEWMETIRHPKFNSPGGPEFSGEGSIWFLVNKTDKAK